MEERPTHPLDYVSVLRRRKWWFITPLVVCLAGGALLSLLLPRTYFSQAEIGIESPTLSPELLKGVQSMDRQERQRAISQQLLSSAVLERVVREEQLAADRPVEAVAASLRTRVRVHVPKPLTGMDNKGLDSFYLGYEDTQPEKTARVANRLAVVFVEENSKTRAARAENTSEVLGRQLKESQERLYGLEEQLRLKKEANMGRLPDQINTNVQMVNGLRNELGSLSTQIRGEQDRLTAVDAELERMRQGTAGAALTSTGAAAVQVAQGRVNQVQLALTQARSIYTDKHPEIDRLRSDLAQAQADLAAARQVAPGNRDEMLQADPIYRQKLNEREALRSRIRTLQMAESNARAQINQFQTAVAAAPRVEQDLASVQREVSLENTRYTDLKKKHEAALDAESLSRTEGGERFSVLYGASLPGAPESPNVARLMLMALALGLALGVGLVIGREFLDRSVHDARTLQNEFEIPVLGEIPRIKGAA